MQQPDLNNRTLPAAHSGPALAAPLGYQTAPALSVKPGKRRHLQWYAMVSVLALVATGIAVSILLLGVASPRARTGNTLIVVTIDPNVGIPLMFLSLAFAWVVSAALAVYWLIWVYTIHVEMRNFTAGAYPISAGKAVGFCFIPFFNLYWLVAMPHKLAKELEVHLGRRRIRSGKVLAFQVLSILPGWLLFGVDSFCRSIAMSEIQRGLNELWRRSPAGISRREADDAAAKLAAMG